MRTSLVHAAARSFGRSNLGVGPLALGCWRQTFASGCDTRTLLESALELGMNLVDTADVYGLDWGGRSFGEVEAQLGQTFKAAPKLREKIVLATKGGLCPGVPYDARHDYLTAACEASLKRLQTDHLDLYFIHRPDLFTPPAEVAGALTALVHSGKVREVGVSNHSPAQVAALQAHLPFALASVQPQFSAHHLAPLFDGTLDQCVQMKLLPMAWSPLAGGLLADGEKAIPGGPRAELLAVLDQLAQREGVTRSAIALAFVLCHPARPVAIVGTTKVERLKQAQAALAVRLEREDCYRIVEAGTGVELP